MGGLLLSAWHLPPRLARAVAAHEAPGPPGDGGDLAVFIHAACGISNLLGCAVPGEPVARPLSPEVMARVGLSQGLAGALPGSWRNCGPGGCWTTPNRKICPGAENFKLKMKFVGRLAGSQDWGSEVLSFVRQASRCLTQGTGIDTADMRIIPERSKDHECCGAFGRG